MVSETFGILGPLVHPERYAHDERVAVTWAEFLRYVDRLCAERPDAQWPAISDEQLETKH